MVEFRLYYDDNGKVVCYTTEDLAGDYVVVDAMTFAMARHDVRVVEGQVVRMASGSHILKLVPDDKGTPCHKENILVVDETDPVYWNLKVYDR